MLIIELYCTYFDHNYLRKGLALYLSLRKQSRPQRAVLVVLALSERCEQILRRLALPDLIILPVVQLEQQEPRLLIAKGNRKTVEYYFTLSPWLVKAALAVVPNAERATYLDSDLYFFHSPDALWQEIGESPVVMVEHRFSPNYADKVIYGRFNVGWNTFDRSLIAQQALNWWAESCLDWCYDRVEGEKFADQGYLSIMYRDTPSTHVLMYPGINLAEYNMDKNIKDIKQKGNNYEIFLPPRKRFLRDVNVNDKYKKERTIFDKVLTVSPKEKRAYARNYHLMRQARKKLM